MRVFIEVREFEALRDYLSDVEPGFYRLIDAHGRLGEDWSVLRHLNGAEDRRRGLIIPPDFNQPTKEEYKFLAGWFKIYLPKLSQEDISLFIRQSPGTLARIKQDFRKEVDTLAQQNIQYQKDIEHFQRVKIGLEAFVVPDHNSCWPETYERIFSSFMKELKISLFGKRLESDWGYSVHSHTVYTFWLGLQGEQVKQALLEECDWLIRYATSLIKRNKEIIDSYPV